MDPSPLRRYKALAVLHMMERRIGEDPFRRVLEHLWLQAFNALRTGPGAAPLPGTHPGAAAAGDGGAPWGMAGVDRRAISTEMFLEAYGNALQSKKVRARLCVMALPGLLAVCPKFTLT